MFKQLTVPLTVAAAAFGLAGPSLADEGIEYLTSEEATNKYHAYPEHYEFAHDGVFGKFDRAQLQRGFQVYREVCSACHSLEKIAFRNLMDLGYTAEQVKAIAAEYEVEDGPDEDGEMYFRAAKPSDYIPGPYANVQQARAANGGAMPPDLSLITKARPHGVDYVASLVGKGYGQDEPEDMQISDGQYYNPYFHSVLLAMPQPLYDEMVEYADGSFPTVEEMAVDVTAFLTWTAEPKLEQRKRTGVGVMIFLAILTVISYWSYKRVWADVKK
ncbi:MAG: cytochrome c1 [Pseudomonadota bacterium]